MTLAPVSPVQVGSGDARGPQANHSSEFLFLTAAHVYDGKKFTLTLNQSCEARELVYVIDSKNTRDSIPDIP